MQPDISCLPSSLSVELCAFPQAAPNDKYCGGFNTKPTPCGKRYEVTWQGDVYPCKYSGDKCVRADQLICQSPPPSTPRLPPLGKGLLGSPRLTKDMLKLFQHSDGTPRVRWLYNYNLAPVSPQEKQWLLDTKIEFVPMVFGSYVNNEWNMLTRCYFGDPPPATSNPYHGSKRCTDGGAELINALRDTEEALGGLRSQFTKLKRLMGANEPWPCAEANQPPMDYVSWWRKQIQPAGRELGLALGTPNVRPESESDHTLGMAGWPGPKDTSPRGEDCKSPRAKNTAFGSIKWFHTFLSHCWEERAASNIDGFPCDVDQIAFITVHRYTCKASKVESEFGKSGKLYSQLDAYFRLLPTEGRTASEWRAWAQARPLLFTETNCEWEGSTGGKPNYNQDSVKNCKKVSGTLSENREEGSINRMTKMMSDGSNVDGFAWWATYNTHWNEKKKQWRPQYQIANFLVTPEAELSPVGRAYLEADGSDVQVQAQCDAAPPPSPPPAPAPPLGCRKLDGLTNGLDLEGSTGKKMFCGDVTIEGVPGFPQFGSRCLNFYTKTKSGKTRFCLDPPPAEVKGRYCVASDVVTYNGAACDA